MKRRLSLLATTVATLFVGGGSLFADDALKSTPSATPVVSKDADFAERQLAFALNIFRRTLENESPDANTLVAPFSVCRVLNALSLGSAGQTKAEIDAALFRSDWNDARWQKEFGAADAALNAAPEATLAGGLWLASNLTLDSRYVERLEKLSRQKATTFDFAHPDARQKVNAWFAENTDGKISNLVETLNSDARLLIADATTFDGKWLNAFNPDATLKGYFTNIRGEEVRFPTMTQTAKFLYRDADGFQYLEAPYSDGRFSLVVVLPDDYKSFAQIERDLTPEILLDCRARAKETELEFRFPKFSVERSFDLDATLNKTGVVDAFSLGADLTPLAGEADLRLDQATQGAFLSVDETGTIAAAATATVFAPKFAIASKTPQFYVDRPFFYFIRSNADGAVLFAGRFVSPEKASHAKMKIVRENDATSSDAAPEISGPGGSLR